MVSCWPYGSTTTAVWEDLDLDPKCFRTSLWGHSCYWASPRISHERHLSGGQQLNVGPLSPPGPEGPWKLGMLRGCGCFLSVGCWAVGLLSCGGDCFKHTDSYELVPGVTIEIGSAARGGESLSFGSTAAWFQHELTVQGNLMSCSLSLRDQRSDSSRGPHQRGGNNFAWVSAWLQWSDPVCLLCCLGDLLSIYILLFHISGNLFHLLSNSSQPFGSPREVKTGCKLMSSR